MYEAQSKEGMCSDTSKEGEGAESARVGRQALSLLPRGNVPVQAYRLVYMGQNKREMEVQASDRLYYLYQTLQDATEALDRAGEEGALALQPTSAHEVAFCLITF
jgi:hypothetical protein